VTTPRSRFLRRQLAARAGVESSAADTLGKGGSTNASDSRPTPQQAGEIWTMARLGARSAGARGPDLDDVAQTVAERLTAKWGDDHVVRARSRGPIAWRAYVRVAARNAYRDLLRREGRLKARERRVFYGVDGGLLPERPGTVRAVTVAPSALDEFEARWSLLELIDQELEGRQREVLALRFIDGLTTQEIAERLGLSIRTVNQAKRAGIARLRSLHLPCAPTAGDES
jgi:RNA polymerase sigma factor (sigma-70 family)